MKNAFDGLFVRSAGACPIRGVHLDLKGLPPTPARMMQLLDLFASLRFNLVLWEWEDTFPWTVDQRFRSETAYTVDEVRRFLARCRELGMQVMPLVQSIGHMETPLSLPEYASLRELPHRSDTLNPLAPGGRQLVERMIDDVLAIAGPITHFHVGGDEARNFGTHPDTKAYVEKHGEAALYLQHIEPLLDKLNARNIRPVLSHDMMTDWDSDALKRLAKKADLSVWSYQGHPDRAESPTFNTTTFQRFHDHGIGLWGFTAYKGAGEHDDDLLNLEQRAQNVLAWSDLSSRLGLKGVIATGWSRFRTHRGQVEPIDSSLDSLVNTAVILHDAAGPAGGFDACVNALHAAGEGERFEACRNAMLAIRRVRYWTWTYIKYVHQQIITEEQDPRRVGSGVLMEMFARLGRHVNEMDAAAGAMRKAFTGAIEPIWVHRYISERFDPVREQYRMLEPRVKKLDPQGYAAHQAGS